MQQVQLFKGIESEVQSLQDQVNDWIRESGAKVISVSGNIAPQTLTRVDASSHTLSKGVFTASDVLIIVLYEGAQ